MSQKDKIVLNFYTTLGCHLCELANELLFVSEIDALLKSANVVVKEIEISDDEALFKRYGVRIPVLRLDFVEEELGWPFDAEMLLAYLEAHCSR